MKLSLSLTQRYLLFVAVIISALFVGSLVISSSVIRSQLSTELRDRLNRSQAALNQYADLHNFSQTQKLETLITSPRFLATVATADSATIAEQAPSVLEQVAAQFLVIRDPSNNVLYSSRPDAAIIAPTRENDSTSVRTEIEYTERDGQIYELIRGHVVTSDNVLLGTVSVGTSFSTNFVEELKRVTDFDVILSQNGSVVGHTESPAVTRVLAASWASTEVYRNDTPSVVHFGDEEIMIVSLPTSYAGSVITFVASVDDRIAPILSRIRLWLVIMSILGAVMAMGAISWYTQRYIGKQVSLLVTATSRISSGDIQTPVVPQSQDELGQLATSVETMRSNLLESRESLEKAHRESLATERHATVGKLAAGIIHDFKNPMAVIKGSAELMTERASDPSKVSIYSQRIQQQVDLMVELARDVLEYSKGNIRLDRSSVRLDQYLKGIIAFHEHQYQESSIGIVLEPGAETNVSLDPSRLKRVFDNILTNAREACSPGSRVVIRWHHHDEGVVIEITDNGPGIPQEIVPTLFDPFVTSGKVHGTGLGLAIAKKIVDDHGGRIDVSSTAGVGTTFQLTLPIVQSHNLHPETAAARR